MCRLALYVSLACVISTAAYAQSGGAPDAPAAPASAPVKLSVLTWTTTATGDWITTYRFATRYRNLIHEENPLISKLALHPALMIAAGGGIDAATAWTTYRLLRRHPRWARAAFYGGAAFRGYLVVHNIQMMQRADAIRASLNYD
jgi:hypothetical protein